MNEPLFLSPSYKARLIAQGLLTIAPPEKIPGNIVKFGPRRVQAPRRQNALPLSIKQNMNPPRCAHSGCDEVCKRYPDGHYGVHCAVHAAELSAKTQRYKKRLRLLQAQRVEESRSA
jgi:hypothetical protein